MDRESTNISSFPSLRLISQPQDTEENDETKVHARSPGRCVRGEYCPPAHPCKAKRDDIVTVLDKGVNKLPACKQAGLQTKGKGSTAFLNQEYSQSITYHGDVSVSLPKIGDAISANLGFSVTRTKSVGTSTGCVNTDGKPHSVWFKEDVGWAKTSVRTTITYQGADWYVLCPFDNVFAIGDGCEKSWGLQLTIRPVLRTLMRPRLLMLLSLTQQMRAFGIYGRSANANFMLRGRHVISDSR